MNPRHHPTEDLLLDYATGALAEAPSLLIATHLTYCSACRGEVKRLEAVGGALVEQLPATAVTTSLDSLFARLDEPAPAESAPPPVQPGYEWAPVPLRPYLPQVPWRSFLPGMTQIPLGAEGGSLRILRVQAGRAMPKHTHNGRELTAVLKGGFSDGGKDYFPGDLAIAGDDDLHTPTAHDDGECICLYLIEGRLKLPGWLGLLLNRFIPH
ncbi:ChrR family anti-sigma-E factor [Lacibacterium aquatile]|uniref:ChrR family anti-sigma-E factor n=1 Tax=Lacibacterium aquatile TaxID=1168082 RepID=A0ABW5DN14_9PROT